MSALRSACFALAVVWPLAASAQLVVRDPPPPPTVVNPERTVEYPSGGTNCDNTIADLGARAVLRAIDSCPFTFFESRKAYYSYARQAILGIAVPGATEAAGALALEKAGENAFFCISGALIDESGANDSDKDFLKALLAEVKENFDRASLADSLAKLRKGLKEKGAVYLEDGEVQTFIKTLDATLQERDDAFVTGELVLAEAGQARFDTPENGSRELRKQAEGLVRECRYDDAETALARAQKLNLEHLLDLRTEVSKAKHLRHCLDVVAQRQRRGPLDSDSPFLPHSQRSADAVIAEAMRRDAEYTQLIGEFAQYEYTVQLRHSDVDVLKERAARQLATAREAAGNCDWTRAGDALATVGAETLDCAVQLDAERRERDGIATLIEQMKEQFAQLEVVQQNIIATPFTEIGSCGELSLVADNFDAIPGQCRELANVESKVAALRNRARTCAEFKSAQLVQESVPMTPVGSLIGRVTLSPLYVDDWGERGFAKTTFADTLVTYERVDLANQMRATIVWSYNGVPTSLSAGQAIAITVTGGVISEQPPNAAGGLALSGVVTIYGDITLNTAQQADRGHPTGLYEFTVNQNPQNVEIHLGGAPMGTGVIWKYTK